MQSLSHFAEPYSAQGNIDARAAAKAIGRPRMDPWDVFLRETLQNSWDARSSDVGGVTYCVDGFWPAKEQIAILKEVVFRERLRNSGLEEYLKADLDQQPVLVVTDFGTKGLGGPTRADRVSDEATDFVDFARNVGRAADKALGGGTYGFGKGILWQVSLCSTVLIYTKSTFRGRRVSRFIAMGHTDSYDRKGQRFTGRHWWGHPDPETSVEPVEGPEADSLAESLGMTRLKGRPSGTSIMVLEPTSSELAETMEQIVGRVASAALWWAWPHMVDRTINFEFSCEGRQIPTPDPNKNPVLRHFAEAYRRTSGMEQASEQWPWHQEVLKMLRPPKRLGSLVWRRIPLEELGAEADAHVDIHSSIALMRRPRFIVKYLSVRADPHGMGSVGVFVADGALNDEFARAEPVAHDDWAPAHMALAKGTPNPVRRALDQIRDTFSRAAAQAPLGEHGGEPQHGLVHLATRIGDLVVGTGDASVVKRKPSPGGSSSKKVTARVVGRPRLRMIEGQPTATFYVQAQIPSGSELPVRVSAAPYVLTESGPDSSSNLEQPRLLAWRVEESIGRHARQGLLLHASGKHELEVDVTVPADSAVSISLTAVEDGETS